MRPLVASVLLIAACSRENRDKPPAAEVARPVLASQDTSRAHRDSVQFRLLADSMGRLEARLENLAGNSSAAPLLFHLGELKKEAQNWMNYRGAGFEYAKQRPTEYLYDEPDGAYLYSGSHWRQLIERFRQDSLADEAGWALAHLTGGGECEGHVDCGLNVTAGPLMAFLLRFPSSDHAMAAVEETNAAFDDILGRIPDLAHPDTANFSEYEPAEVVPIVSRYDSAAARLPAAARTAAYQYTTEIWTRLGMPERRH